MSPPLTMALMQSRPLLDPLPPTVVGDLLISNALLHKCRISDHLHLVFQWGIHTSLYRKRQVTSFTNVYTAPALTRSLRKHEGHPARAPDGTIMEIGGESCPGSTGESVGPWDLGNVHLCEGFEEWSSALSRTLKMALKEGLSIQDINTPVPTREELEKANESESQWLSGGKPLHSTSKKNLIAHRDGIRDKLDAFLGFVDAQIKSDDGKEAVFATLRRALDSALAGMEVGEYNGVLGGMVNKIVGRVEEFIKYMEDKIEAKDAREQRVDEIRKIVDVALKGKEKRKRDDEEEDTDQQCKKVITEDIRRATEKTLTSELALGACSSKAERRAKLTHVQRREGKEAKKEKDKVPEPEKSKGKDKQASDDKVSIEEDLAREKSEKEPERIEEYGSSNQAIDETSAEKLSTEDSNTKKSSNDHQPSSENANTESLIATSIAKAKGAEVYSSKFTTPSAPGSTVPTVNPRAVSPPPPYSEFASPVTDSGVRSPVRTTLLTPSTVLRASQISAASESTSPITSPKALSPAQKTHFTPSMVPTTPKTAATSLSPEQRGEDRTSMPTQSRAASPGHTKQPVLKLHMTQAARVLDKIRNPGKYNGRSLMEEDLSHTSVSSTPPTPSSPSTPITPSRAPTSSVKNVDVSIPERDISVLPQQDPRPSPPTNVQPLEVIPAYSTIITTPVISLPQSKPVSSSPLAPEKPIISKNYTKESRRGPESQTASSSPHAPEKSIISAKPTKMIGKAPENEQSQGQIQIEEEDESSLFLPPTKPHIPAPKLATPAPAPAPKPRQRQTSYELDLPPPPKPRLGSSNAPIDIDLDSDSHPNSLKALGSNTKHTSRARISTPNPSKQPTKLASTSTSKLPRRHNVIEIKDEPSNSNSRNFSFIEIKDEADDVKPVMKARPKPKPVKPVRRVRVKDEDEVMMCDESEWVREVKEKNRTGLDRVRSPW